MKKVYIIHGYGGYPGKNWFPWLKEKLERYNIEVIIPAMPNTESPDFKNWISHLQFVINKPNKDTYLVGHSLGCISILRYLETLQQDEKVGGVILVAGFVSPIHFSELDEFTKAPINEGKIKSIVSNIIAISSDNDPHIPYTQAEEIRDYLSAKLITVPNGGHLNEKSGYTDFPLVFEELVKMMGLDPL